MAKEIEIVGAGPAGIVAAINLAKAGCKVTVYEEKSEVGHRFHGDFQLTFYFMNDYNSIMRKVISIIVLIAVAQIFVGLPLSASAASYEKDEIIVLIAVAQIFVGLPLSASAASYEKDEESCYDTCDIDTGHGSTPFSTPDCPLFLCLSIEVAEPFTPHISLKAIVSPPFVTPFIGLKPFVNSIFHPPSIA
ncbi:MAG: NAD(P)-binding protein [Deltaproteobacteria bacterium]|nr:NAD(P)-binding protein [Deltaproteobacteria bacterium]